MHDGQILKNERIICGGCYMVMKFRAHETFFIRKGWLSKGMKAIKNDPMAFISKEKNPMDTLGIGSNMVKSLRYWLQAVGIAEEPNSGKRIQTFTPLGERIYKHDRYIEELGTLYLLQYRLASQDKLATSWYYFYNVFNMTEFTRDDFVAGLNGFVIEANGEGAAMRSLTDDFNCIIGTYVPRYKTDSGKVSPENNIDCPFGELGLVDIVDRNRKVYRKVSPSAENIDPWVILAVLMDQAAGGTEVGLNDLFTAPKNIGKVFNLDTITMIDALREAEKTGAIKIIRTAGLDIVRIDKSYTFDECVEKYYESIEKSRG